MYDLKKRRPTRQIHIGKVAIGGGAPISVQSMTNTKTTDTEATVAQIRALQAAGCDIVRLAVPDMEAAKNLGNILRQVTVPLVADIHFDYKLALEAIHQGIHALRLNPGNIGGEEKVKAVVKAAKEAGIPIRIGVNAGSLDKKILKKYGGVTPEALVESAMEHVRILEALDFHDMKISLKAHDVPLTIAAYRLMSQTVDYPLHLGITIEEPIEVAVMGCVVKGPGEARGADVGIAGGNGEGLIFRKGEIVRKVPEADLVNELFQEIDQILEERKHASK